MDPGFADIVAVEIRPIRHPLPLWAASERLCSSAGVGGFLLEAEHQPPYDYSGDCTEVISLALSHARYD